MDHLQRSFAEKLPADIRKHIVQNNFVGLAQNTTELDTPMEYLFDAYMEFVDVTGEHDDWNCWKCREHVLVHFRLMLPHLINLENADKK